MNDPTAQNKSLVKIWCKTITNVVSVGKVAGRMSRCVTKRVEKQQIKSLQGRREQGSVDEAAGSQIWPLPFRETATFASLWDAASLAWCNACGHHRSRPPCLCCLFAPVLETQMQAAGASHFPDYLLPEEAHIRVSHQKLSQPAVQCGCGSP